MNALNFDYFTAAVGERFDMCGGDESLPVQLVEASPLADSGREGGSFRLEFLGPAAPVIAQGTYSFRRGGDADDANDIFVCPIGRDEAGTRYEAVFY